jgi:hypothetical protein
MQKFLRLSHPMGQYFPSHPIPCGALLPRVVLTTLDDNYVIIILHHVDESTVYMCDACGRDSRINAHPFLSIDFIPLYTFTFEKKQEKKNI